jgi:MSHA biogenesis protein MshO
MSSPRRTGPATPRGFTLIEVVVSLAICAIVVVFASMFISAPLGAYEAQARRSVLLADASTAWPRLQADLRQALPNSLRTRRNGNFVVVEMLSVVDVARYMTPTGASFTAAGTTQGVFRGITLPFNSNTHYLSVNNLGTAGANAYALAGSMTPAGTTIQVTAAAQPGEATVTVNPAPAFAADSPRRQVYLVSGPVAYLCDESQGTIRRYSGYAIAANQAARDAPGDFAGATAVLVANGISTCAFQVSGVGGNESQTLAVRLTTTRAGESVALLHTSRAEYVP